ncbi:hypothetical protein JG688_00010221 [Phytophthora aleatoria]|uniref:Uncharacterized protein n=1 Tax=Phytophthora aleatoria TaxID=2496075 RepID=A0A8J5J2B7_9STRA|nr:hypothetical protein JG688_00010221 [Phytophthora aleatoria]
MAQTHPVNGESVANLLKQLGLLEMVKAHPKSAALIFVVPKSKAAGFELQPIELEELTDETKVSKLDQIVKKREEFLNDAGITTIGDLRMVLLEEEAQATTMLVENISFNTLRKLHFKHDEKQKLAELKRTLEAIPQFVKGVKGLKIVGLSVQFSAHRTQFSVT